MGRKRASSSSAAKPSSAASAASGSLKMDKGGESVGPSLDDVKWNAVSLAIAVAIYYTTFPLAHAHKIELWWIAMVFVRNFVLMGSIFQAFHYFLYESESRKSLEDLKFISKFPEQYHHDRDRRWTLISLLINSAIECTMLHLFATGRIASYANFWEYPAWSVAWLVLSPFWRELHFFIYHITLHVQPLYGWFHKHHHLSFNPGPWSGLSMHPVESITYFSGPVILAAALRLHPIHYLFANVHAQIASVYGHHGYDTAAGSFFHIVHHAKVHCNYGTPFLPLDILTGTWRTTL